MEIKTVSQCTLEQVLHAWNKGFEGYFVEIDMNEEMFLTRLVGEGLSPKLSIVAFANDEPVGIVMNGFRQIDGKKTSWNGGTGVSPNYRGKGVSRALMEETIAIYEREGIEIATLEAIKENVAAIALYKKFGYVITDHLLYLSGDFEAKINKQRVLQVKTIRPEQLAHLPVYREEVPWQCSWQSNKQGEAKVFYNDHEEAIGYLLYRTVCNQEGAIDRIILYQLELLENGKVEDIPYFLSTITNQKVKITTVNFLANNPATDYLIKNGLEVTTEQVQMKKYWG
ncbi:N-acetyltransferase family protein [Lysinibacillus sp. NPDC047702]|uniref:GNAT family N-acetyltransferase n=1 Tax=unclassified Lysinibacillus TaxID=2636778 RepID=UPI003CFD5D6E